MLLSVLFIALNYFGRGITNPCISITALIANLCDITFRDTVTVAVIRQGFVKIIEARP